MKNVLFFSLIIFVFASGCSEISGRRIKGSGNITSETRTVSGFRNIDVSGAIDVFIKQDSVTSVKVEADDNIQQYVQVHTQGSALEIYTDRGLRLSTSRKIKVYVTNPAFDGFKISGASSVIGENEINSGDRISLHLSGASEGRLDINAPKVLIDISGASSANLRGRTKDLEANASGASKIRAYDLLSENADVDVNGASHADIYASVSLDGEASGASGVNYRGNASNSVRTSGASHVSKKD
jgi:hypothetical protein